MTQRIAARLCLAVLTLPLLSGCVAAAIPLAAAGVIARDQVKASEEPVDPNAPPPRPQPVDLAAITIRDSADAAPAAAPAVAEPVVPPPAMVTPVPAPPPPAPEPAAAMAAAAPVAVTEAAAAAASPYAALLDHVRARSALVAEGAPVISLVLENSLTLREPDYVDCGQRPPAVLVDADADPQGPAAGPGDTALLAAALRTIRDAGVSVIWVTDRPAGDAPAIAERLAAVGIDADGRDTVAGTGPVMARKQLVRRAAAMSHCIIAVVGDRRGDADEAYDYLRSSATPLVIDGNWGNGWFLLPAPPTANPAQP